MNAAINYLYPLPTALATVDPPAGRRHRIGDYDIDEVAMDLFNQLLIRLDRCHRPLHRDQLATAARDLGDRPGNARASPCIVQRMRRAGAMDLMLADPDWDADRHAADVAGLVVSYVRGNRDLIPDTLPRVGRLDDAIVIDAAWPIVAPEVRDYLDFCRVRHEEARLAGNAVHFGRDDWQAASRAEARWIEHCQRVASSSYLPSAPTLFRIQ